MNLGGVVNLAQTLVNRKDVDLPAKLLLGINLAHDEIQKTIPLGNGGVLDLNWQAMEMTADLTYPASGPSVALPAGFKSLRNVWRIGTDGVTLTPLLASTQDEVNALRGVAHREPVPAIGNDYYHQRYFVAGQQLSLFLPPKKPLQLRCDYYGVLPQYNTADLASTDWFSQNESLALAWGACMFASINFWEDDRVAMFTGKWREQVMKDYQGDVQSKQGAAWRVYRPPVRIGRI